MALFHKTVKDPPDHDQRQYGERDIPRELVRREGEGKDQHVYRQRQHVNRPGQSKQPYLAHRPIDPEWGEQEGTVSGQSLVHAQAGDRPSQEGEEPYGGNDRLFHDIWKSTLDRQSGQRWA